jgi:hypothetical protein
LRVEQGATFRRTLYWRQPLVDLTTGEYLFDASGNIIPGPPVDLTGYTGRMHIRRTVRDATFQLELTSANGGVTVATPVIRMAPYVRAATTTSINLATQALDPIDGVTPTEGERVLVRAQNDANENGIYTAREAEAWTRDPAMSSAEDLTVGAAVYVTEGTINAGKTFRQMNTVADLSDPQLWEESPVGRIEILATDEQTEDLTASGVYDIELESSGGEVYRLMEGKVRLSQSVTREDEV